MYPLGRSAAQLEPRGGFVGLGSVGYALGNGFRFELEGNYRQATSWQRDGLPSVPAASVQTYGVMANALFDIDVGVPWLYPYIGGGVGYAWTHLSQSAIFAPASFPLISNHFDQTEGNFAFQAIGGLSFPIPGVPGLSLTIGIPLLRRAGQRELRRHSGRGGLAGAGARYPQGRSTSTTTASCSACATPSTSRPRCRCPDRQAAPAARGGALLSGVLRLGQGDADRSRAADHQGGGRQLHPRPVHAHRGERLHRHLGHASVQPGPLGPPRHARCRPN